jgi:hypothetical protein
LLDSFLPALLAGAGGGVLGMVFEDAVESAAVGELPALLAKLEPYAARTAGVLVGVGAGAIASWLVNKELGEWIGGDVKSWGTSPFVQGGPNRYTVRGGIGFLYLPSNCLMPSTKTLYTRLAVDLSNAWQLTGTGDATTLSTAAPATVRTAAGAGATATASNSDAAALSASAARLGAADAAAQAAVARAKANSARMRSDITALVGWIDSAAVSFDDDYGDYNTDAQMQSLMATAATRLEGIIGTATAGARSLHAELTALATAVAKESTTVH